MSTDPWLHQLSVRDVRAHLERDGAVLLPVGSVEQHGTHLPLGTDTLTASAVAEAAAVAAGALVAPPVWYGWSSHHMAHPGTVTVQPETLIAVVADIGRSLAAHGFTSLVVVNGHRFSNAPPLSVAATRVFEETGMLTVVADLAYLGASAYSEWTRDPASGGFAHGDAYETAHIMHLHPELVGDIPAGTDEPHDLGYEAYDPWNPSPRAVWWPVDASEVRRRPTGGAPSWATAKRGDVLHRALVSDLAALVEQVRSRAKRA